MEHNKHIIVPRKYRKDKTEVSCVVKYLMFGFNVLFWVSAIQWNHFFFRYQMEFIQFYGWVYPCWFYFCIILVESISPRVVSPSFINSTLKNEIWKIPLQIFVFWMLLRLVQFSWVLSFCLPL
jgi:hypothetical protein